MTQLIRNTLCDRQCKTNHCVVCPRYKDRNCFQRGLLYRVKCLTCSALYIDETGCVPSVPMKGRLASKRKGSLISVLRKRRYDDQNGEVFYVICKILNYEPEASARKVVVAFWIFVRNQTRTMEISDCQWQTTF